MLKCLTSQCNLFLNSINHLSVFPYYVNDPQLNHFRHISLFQKIATPIFMTKLRMVWKIQRPLRNRYNKNKHARGAAVPVGARLLGLASDWLQSRRFTLIWWSPSISRFPLSITNRAGSMACVWQDNRSESTDSGQVTGSIPGRGRCKCGEFSSRKKSHGFSPGALSKSL